MPNPILNSLKRCEIFVKKCILKPLTRCEAFAKKHNPMFLSVSTALPVALMCVVETLAIKFNKKTPDDQKNFLIPQTLSEGALSLAITLGLSACLSKFASHLLVSGKFKPSSIFVKSKDNAKKFVEQELPAVLKKQDNMKKLLRSKDFESLPQEIADRLGNNKRDVFDAVKNAEKGFKTLVGAVTGLFLASNVATPFVTNSFAKWYRNKYATSCKHKADKAPEVSRPLVNSSILQDNTFNSFKGPDLKSKNMPKLPRLHTYPMSLKI